LKRVLKIFAVGVCTGLLLVVIQKGLQIDEDVFMRGYWAIALAVLAGVVLVNVLYNISYQKRIKRLAALLEAGKPEEYLAGVEKLLETTKGKNLRNILKIDLAAGYIELKQFSQAIDVLEGVSDKELTGAAVKAAYRINLCTSYFHTAQGGKALELYNSSQKIFESQQISKLYGGSIAILDMLAAIQNEQYGQAERLLDRARRTWSDSRFQKAFQEIDDTLAEMKKENIS